VTPEGGQAALIEMRRAGILVHEPEVTRRGPA
jgi:hypothetical protein